MLKWSRVASCSVRCERRYSFFETKNGRHVPSSLALMLSVFALLFVANQSTFGAVKTQSSPPLGSGADQPVTLSLADYGVGDGITDAGPPEKGAEVRGS